jgi:thiol-disulfide isomerase/thioredoxin
MPRRPDLRLTAAVGLTVVTAGVWWWAQPDSTGTDPVVVIDGVGDTSSRPTAPDLAGQALPDIALLALDGRSVRLPSLAGTPMVLNVWASTCAPCRAEMPALQRFAEEYAGRVAVVGVDPLDAAADLRAFAAEVAVTYPLYHDPEGELLVAFGVTDLPTTLLVRADGTVAAVHLGALEDGELRSLVATELGVG